MTSTTTMSWRTMTTSNALANLMDMVNPNTRELKRLPWVDSARKYGGSYIIKTKPGVLKTTLTRKIRLADSGYYHKYNDFGSLEKPITLTLPQYVIKLNHPDLERKIFEVKLACKPTNPRDNKIGVIPTYQSLVSVGEAVKGWYTPCYGSSEEPASSVKETYRAAKGWRERANEVAQWLQIAEPHYGMLWYRTAFAYRLGLVGDEVFAADN